MPVGLDSWWTVVVISFGAFLLGAGFIGSFILLRRLWLRSLREREGLKAEGERKFSHLFNTVSDCIYIHSPDGIILEVNESVAQLFGKAVGDLVGRQLVDVFGARHQQAIVDYLHRISNTTGEVHGIVYFIFKPRFKVIHLEYRSTPVITDGVVTQIQGIARDITEGKQYERSIRRSEGRLKQILEQATTMQRDLEVVTREMMRIQEEERVKISRELHDEIGQLLGRIRVNLKLMRKAFDGSGNAQLLHRIAETEELSGDMFGRIRHFLRELRPMGLDEFGLVAAIRRLATQYSEQEGFSLTISGDIEPLDRFDGEKRTIVFRVIQEGLANIVKHANATIVTIDVSPVKGGLLITITDNGVGFVVHPLKSSSNGTRGIGLLGMRERVKLIDGVFGIESKVGIGTAIRVMIPIDEPGENDQDD